MRTRIAALLAAVLVLVVGAAAPASAGPEGTFVSKINAARAANGLPPLQSHGGLASAARSWSQHMMDAGAISHNPSLGSVASGWESLGENVGVGPDANVIHQEFMGSAAHRRNVLGDYTHVGVGVVGSESVMWVTVVFMKELGAAPPTTTTTIAATTAPPPDSQTASVSEPAAEPAPPPPTEAAPADATSPSPVLESASLGHPRWRTQPRIR